MATETPAEPAIAACLIVKDEEEVLERSLASVRPYVDQVNVFDTGSTDGTHAILERLGAEPGPPVRWQRGEWRDDFAWARNRSFDMASECEWLMWVDADDVVEGAENIKPAIAAQSEVDVFGVAYRNGNELFWRERIVRRAAGFRWQRIVHTFLVPPPGVTFALLPAELVTFVHSPTKESDPGRGLRLLLIEKEREPTPLTDFDLGREYVYLGKHRKASEAFTECLAQMELSELRIQAWAFLATALRALGQDEKAIEAEMKGEDELHEWQTRAEAGLVRPPLHEAFAISGVNSPDERPTP